MSRYTINQQIAQKFHTLVNETTPTTEDYKNNFIFLLKNGIVLSDPKKATKKTTQMLINLFGINTQAVNSTFFQNFEEIESLSEFTKRILQLVNYLTINNEGIPSFLPNNKPESVEYIKNNFTVIDVISEADFKQKVLDLINSGAALSDVESIFSIFEFFDWNFVESKNKEFNIRYYIKNNIIVENIDTFFACLYYILSDKTTFVKNDFFDTFLTISPNIEKAIQFIKNYTEQYGILKFASNIRRYRDVLLFLRSKGDEKYKPLFNKILRLNKKFNNPKTYPISTKLSDTNFTISQEDLDKYLESANIYQLIRYYNILTSSITQNGKSFPYVYKIRNGKTFVKTEEKHKNVPLLFGRRNSVLSAIKKKYDFTGMKFYIPKNQKIGMPTSEKNFIGDIPFGSSITMDKKFNFGIYWQGRPNQHIDFDLSFVEESGKVSSWNRYYSIEDSLYFSGDMTSLNKNGFASEVFAVKDSSISGFFTNTLFSNNSQMNPYKYTFFISSYNKDNVNIIDNGDKIYLSGKSSLDESNSETIAYLQDNTVYLVGNGFQMGRVANYSLINNMREFYANKLNNMMTLNKLIPFLGGTILEEYRESDDNIINLDLANITMEKVTSLFKK